MVRLIFGKDFVSENEGFWKGEIWPLKILRQKELNFLLYVQY